MPRSMIIFITHYDQCQVKLIKNLAFLTGHKPGVMKRILVPTDFSENATNALEYAVETASALKAELLILHVYKPPVFAQSALQSVVADDVARATKAFKERLKITQQTIQQEYPGLRCLVDVAIGDPVAEVLSSASEKKVDMIVMGTQGASRMVNVIFGSNTAAIIDKAECPVLCIPYSLPYKKPEKILFATNFSYSDIEGAIMLTKIASVFDAAVVFGHVVVGAEETEEEHRVIEKFAKEIRRLTNYEKIKGMVISDASIHTGLDTLVEKSAVDMIALATRKRTFLERIYNPSITKKFSYYSTIPMLAFQSPKDEEKTGKDFV